MMRAEGIGCFMHAPLELGPRLYGVLSVAHEDPDRFGNEDLELLVQLARSSTAAIANAIDFERERRIARALTLGFVPESLPELPGYETGLLYSPAAGEPTGGDIYGIWRLPGRRRGPAGRRRGRQGRGDRGASARWSASSSRRAAGTRASPAAVLAQTNAMLGGRLPADSFVTAFLGVLSAGSLRYANAGHLPPLLVAGRRGARAGRAGAAARGIGSTRYEEAELRSPGRAPLRLHRRPDRGPPLGRALRPRPPGPLVADTAPSTPRGAGPGRARRDRGWAGGLTDDAVALALAPPDGVRSGLTRGRAPHRAAIRLNGARCLTGPTRAPEWTRPLRRRAWGRWWPRWRGSTPAAPRARRCARATTRTCCGSTTGAASRSPPTGWAPR